MSDDRALVDLPPAPTEGGPDTRAHADHFYAGTWLPLHRADGTLPPHVGERMVLRHPCAPYPLSLSAFAEQFVTSSERVNLFLGLLDLRRDLAGIGVAQGFQWVGGSFVERQPRDPRDVDVVTFFVMPSTFAEPGQAEALAAAHPALFSRRDCMAKYRCDSFLVRLAMREEMFRAMTLWYALLAHDRKTLAWKGFVQLSLDASQDAEARAWAERQRERLRPASTPSF
jgi:hypothetical protein